jgi:molybdopterin-guanine dinucleotide biosynthesis protein A
MIQIPCVIFAGGKSSRMGEDKSLLPFHGYNTLTQYQYSRLKKIFKNVYISCKNKNKFDFKAPFIEDIKTKDIFAPTVGFVSIFEVLDDDSFFAISVDSPFIDENIIKKLILSDDQKNDATIAKTSFGIEPMCGIYHKSIQNSFKKMLKEDNYKLGYLLKNANATFVDFTNNKNFLNINYPSQYQEALNQNNT